MRVKQITESDPHLLVLQCDVRMVPARVVFDGSNGINPTDSSSPGCECQNCRRGAAAALDPPRAAREIYQIEGVIVVVFDPYTVHIRKAPLFSWTEILPQVKTFLQMDFAGDGSIEDITAVPEPPPAASPDAANIAHAIARGLAAQPWGIAITIPAPEMLRLLNDYQAAIRPAPTSTASAPATEAA